MLRAGDARELSTLLRISSELDILGDVTATVDNPSELLAWARTLDQPAVLAWRAKDSGHRFVQVASEHHKAPVRGLVTAVLECDRHADFWDALTLTELANGQCSRLTLDDLAKAWTEMPLAPPTTSDGE
ncbi:hypothetical protein [Nocardioides marmorisolisilvae]|uniref:Uncharacterized protein n=1 Tax=Nocardioides marmorisolisilvae TaxID=1542737 RepID=A0A3N0DPK7_9ACTN|nr:hypothetical protein [Nocardioides marmorisolisilvae]RNL77565.1 hypothetical protein EFL95_16270 [Nocardioides marmorisolisilvae]